jgi:hypothetical protein
MNYKFILAIILITATANVTIGAGLGIPIEVDAKKSASQSGYNHGEKDCNKYQNGNGNLYITGYNKEGESTGPAHHTDTFNESYIEGWVSEGCSVNQFYNLDFSNDGNGYQNQNTRVTTNTAIGDNRQQQGNAVETVQSSNQRGECGQIVFGDCNIGQSNTQKSENTQANSAQND